MSFRLNSLILRELPKPEVLNILSAISKRLSDDLVKAVAIEDRDDGQCEV